MRILSVDDDQINRLVMAGFLRKMAEVYKCEYEVAGSGMEALQLCAETRYDLVFMDIMMPEMDGVECVKAMNTIYRGQGLELPTVVMVTACDDLENRRKAAAAGAIGYLTKPIKREELIDWVQTVIFGKKLDRRSEVGEGDIGLRDE